MYCDNKQINLVCQTEIINRVDRLDPTDHTYLKVKRVKFNEKKKTDPQTMKPQPRLMCYLYHNFFFFVINPVKSI